MPNDTQALAAPLKEPSAHPTPDHPQAMLTTTQAAGVLGLSPRTVEQLRVKGGGPEYFALGKRAIRYRRHALESWLDARARKSTSDPGLDEAGRAS